MPNHCQNIVTFEHPHIELLDELYKEFERVDEIKSVHDGGPFTYLRPTPIDLLKNDRWSAWRVVNWGTDLECYWLKNLNLCKEEKKLTVRFHTRWSPPHHLYEYLHENTDWQIDAYYFEPGIGFYGWFNKNSIEYFSEKRPEMFCLITSGFGNYS